MSNHLLFGVIGEYVAAEEKLLVTISIYLSIAYADNLIEHQTMLENVISSLLLEAPLRF